MNSKKELELGPPLKMATLRSLWPRYKDHNEVRPLILEILRLQRTLRTVEDLREDAKRGADTDPCVLRDALGMLLVLMREEPCIAAQTREPGKAKAEWILKYLPPKSE